MSDAPARTAAVEPNRSVIVQAPAGSGKTTLLAERFLGLLAEVENPEEILAITFTRKAANEMRERVLRYLAPEFHTDEPHEQGPYQKALRLRDKVDAWQLLANPHRLMIRTIDSFNHYLARTMPVASTLGPVPAPADNARALYRQAARNVLNLVGESSSREPLAEDVARLLRWRDHRSQDIENILADLLAQRDQWIRALNATGTLQRQHLEDALRNLVTGRLTTAAHVVEKALSNTDEGASGLCALLRFAGQTLLDADQPGHAEIWCELQSLPGTDPAELHLWQAISDGLLTSDGKLRKGVNIRNGFPAKCEEKERFKGLLEDLADASELTTALAQISALPPPHYSDEEWQVLDALVRVLHRAAVELQLVFAQRGQTDYTGLAAAALTGLGDEERGFSDLGLYLDNRIKHLLVDEFQDTNWGQLRLLEKLTAGWVPGDGRTLFLVGDPMQSIYRFREAEVGLFMRAQEMGVGEVKPEPLTLHRNFRARAGIVEWINDYLGPIFPRTQNIAEGAVTYTPSEAGRSSGGAVEIHAHADELAEARSLVSEVKKALQSNLDNDQFSAAIIVRGRDHLRQILPELNRQQVPFRAVKLDPLVARPVVQDLLSLTRAILHPANTTALLSLLRAPFCGLSLQQLHALAGDGRSPFDPDALQRLAQPAQQRAARVFNTLASAQALTGRRPIRELIEGAWAALGGPACCEQSPTSAREVQIYLQTLERADADDLLSDWNDFSELLQAQFTEGDPPSDEVRLEILTMHGAKGLEWDLVVLPALHRRAPPQQSSLLEWLPVVQVDEREHILLAPLRSARQAQDPPLNKLIRSEQRSRAAFENQRLLYVATTRARERLILSACLDPEKEDVAPTAGSLLADLWPTTSHAFLQSLATATPSAAEPVAAALDQSLRRIADDWAPPARASIQWHAQLPPSDNAVEIEYNWAGNDARRTGTVLHSLLEVVGRRGIEQIDETIRQKLHDLIPNLLLSAGIGADSLSTTTRRIEQALAQSLESSEGQWILSNKHTDSACELPISGVLDGRLVNAIIDRTFVDADGVRWIIDYKSGYHAGADLETFLTQEAERYAEQLNRYKRLFEQMEDRVVKTALYLPSHGVLRTVHD